MKRAIVIGILGLVLIAVAIGLSLLQRPSEPAVTAQAPAPVAAPPAPVAPPPAAAVAETPVTETPVTETPVAVAPAPVASAPQGPSAGVAQAPTPASTTPKPTPTANTAANTGVVAPAVVVPAPDQVMPAPVAASPMVNTPAAPVAEAPQPIPPSFDVVRVDDKGDTVIAGRAAPNAEVTVRDGEKSIGTVTTDSRGEFVFLPETALAPGQRTLSLESKDPVSGATVVSKDEVVLAVPERGKTVSGAPAASGDTTPLAVLVPRDGSGGARPLQVPEPPLVAVAPDTAAPVAVPPTTTAQVATAAPTATTPTATTPTQPVANPPAEAIAPVVPSPAASAPAAITAAPAQTRAVAAQPAAPATPPAPIVAGEAKAPVSVDVVDYDQSGNVTMGGQAQPGTQVQIYVDNSFVGRVEVPGSGRWTVTPVATIAPGRYLLRVDQLGGGGIVTARAELPFTRADVSEVTMQEGRAVVVQPGNSLWRIARRVYGKGLMFSDIYRANRDQIRNPDMIYPGQIFVVPSDEQKAG